MPAFRKALLIRNPTAGVNWSQALSQRVLRELKDWIPTLEIQTTEFHGHGIQLAKEAAFQGYDLVIAAGGDGTLNEVVNGCVGTGTAVGFLPGGTGNSMAYSLGLPHHPLEVIRAFRGGEVGPAYLGEADGRYFVLMVGIGFDAVAVRSVPYRLKRLLGRFSYIVAGSSALIRYSYPLFNIIADGQSYQGSTVIISKSQYYASRFQIAPDVSLEEPTFQVCIFTGRGPLNYLKYVGAVVMNRHLGLRDVISVKARSIQIQPVPGLLAHMDGDVLSTLPEEIRVADQQIRMLFPREE